MIETSDTLDIDDLVVRPAEVFKQKQGTDVFAGYSVEAIDPAGRIVRGTALRAEPFESQGQPVPVYPSQIEDGRS